MADRAAPVIIFNSTHQELKAESCLKRHGIAFEVVPLPDKVQAGCGLALEISPDDLGKARRFIAADKVEIKAIHNP